MAQLWAALALEAAGQAAIVASVVLAVVAAGRRWPAPVREGLLLVALVKFLTPPFVHVPGGLLALASSLLPDFGAAATGMAAPAAAPTADWMGPFVLAHAAGALLVVLAVAAEAIRVSRMRGRARPAPAPVAEAARAIAQRIGLRRRVTILIGEDATPLAMGVWRRSVLVSAALVESFGTRDLDAVLAHELMHHRRHHLAWTWVRLGACAIWWWHPAVWLTSRALRHVQEESCDEGVVEAGIIEREPYCDVLLRAAAVGASPLSTSAALAERLHPLARRVVRLLDRSNLRIVRPGVARATIVVAAMLLLPGVPRDEPRVHLSATAAPSASELPAPEIPRHVAPNVPPKRVNRQTERADPGAPLVSQIAAAATGIGEAADDSFDRISALVESVIDPALPSVTPGAETAGRVPADVRLDVPEHRARDLMRAVRNETRSAGRTFWRRVGRGVGRLFGGRSGSPSPSDSPSPSPSDSPSPSPSDSPSPSPSDSQSPSPSGTKPSPTL